MRQYFALFIAILLSLSGTAWAEDRLSVQELTILSGDYLPAPYSGVSYQESAASFEPVRIMPEQFEKQINDCQSPDELNQWFNSIGINMDIYDAEYVYFYRNRKDKQTFPLKSGGSLTTVSYAYAREENDNCVFLFWQEDGQTHLIDSIFNFGHIQVMTDSEGQNTWLIGHTGASNHQTVRWYHLGSQRIVLSYLVHGIQADRTDYHFKVQTTIEPAFTRTLPEDDTFTMVQQVSAIDLSSSTHPDDLAQEILLYMQEEIYQAQKDGGFVNKAQKTF